MAESRLNFVAERQKMVKIEKEELRSKIKELVSNEQFLKTLYEETENVINSGMVNIEDAEEGYGLGKVVLFCGLKRLAYKYKPATGTRLEADNKSLLTFYKSY